MSNLNEFSFVVGFAAGFVSCLIGAGVAMYQILKLK